MSDSFFSVEDFCDQCERYGPEATTELQRVAACPFCRRVWPEPHKPTCRLYRGKRRG